MRPSSLIALSGILAVTLLATGCSKNSTSTDTSTTTSSATTAPKSAGGAANAHGAQVFSSNCASCHQAAGQGQPGAFPPLAKKSVVTGDAAKVIHIVKYGLTGKIQVNGQSYNGQMPPWKGQLSDADIASVITYVRSSWGNSAGPVTTAQVTAVKQ